MKTISKRELNQQTAQVLAGVHAGEPVLVTERGIARWRIEVVDAASDPIARLRAEGRIRAASKNPPPWPENDEAAKQGRTPADVDALYEEMRGDH
jgi:antitoxin (DNA-binding transcriptional repressor) of toxin-antitoxin stability system